MKRYIVRPHRMFPDAFTVVDSRLRIRDALTPPMSRDAAYAYAAMLERIAS